MSRASHDYPAARQQRRTMSLPEVLLWQRFRVAPVKLRRQHPVGPFVIDYYCAAAGLGVEIDGLAHDMGNRPEQDIARDRYLAGQGITILRMTARDVLRDVDAAAEMIIRECEKRIAG